MAGYELEGHFCSFKDMYDTDISADTLSAITDKVIPQVKE